LWLCGILILTFRLHQEAGIHIITGLEVRERLLSSILLRGLLCRTPSPPNDLTINFDKRNEDRLMLWALNAF
jgi:hypothetical protein